MSIIEIEDRAAGGLSVEEKPDSIYVHELQVVPERQGQGIGTAVMRHVIERGGKSRRCCDALGGSSQLSREAAVRAAWV